MSQTTSDTGVTRSWHAPRMWELPEHSLTDLLAVDRLRPPETVLCPTCRAPGEHCLCHAETDKLRYALAQISLIHQARDGVCAGCGTTAALCGYITLLQQVRLPGRPIAAVRLRRDP